MHTRVFPHMGLCHGQVIVDVWNNRCQNAPLIKIIAFSKNKDKEECPVAKRLSLDPENTSSHS